MERVKLILQTTSDFQNGKIFVFFRSVASVLLLSNRALKRNTVFFLLIIKNDTVSLEIAIREKF